MIAAPTAVICEQGSAVLSDGSGPSCCWKWEHLDPPQTCSGDGLQSVIQGEFEAKMELWNMALPPFLCLCMEQRAGTQTFLC